MLINIPKKFYALFVFLIAVILCFVSIKPATHNDKQYKNKLDTSETQTSEETNKNQQTDNANNDTNDNSNVTAGAIIEGNIIENKEDRKISDEEKEEAKKTLGDNIEISDIEKGTILSLNNEPLYISSVTPAENPSNYKNGTYYAWGYEAAGRIAITNKSENIGVRGQVTGWINKPATQNN